MLVVKCKVGEALMIGDDITVTILGAKGGKIRIGTHAPADIKIQPEEVDDNAKVLNECEETP